MGATIEFYAANERELVDTYKIEDFDEWFEAKSLFPKADFSIHLQIPDDLDRLLFVMREQGFELPEKLADMMVRESWADSHDSAWIHLLSDKFKCFSRADPPTIESIVQKWSVGFEDSPGALQDCKPW